MKPRHGMLTRRSFLRTTAFGTLGGALSLRIPRWRGTKDLPGPPSRASLIKGDSRADNVFKALKLIEEDIRRALARKRKVLIKPNFVSIRRQLSATHVDCVAAILEFLQPLIKDEILIAESPADGMAAEGYRNYRYYDLRKKYEVRFLDLDDQPVAVTHVIDEGYRPRPIRFSRLLLDPNTFIISAAVMKTHDRAVATLSLKNIAVGGAIKDKGFRWGTRVRSKSDKPIIHGGPANEGIHYNLFKLAKLAPPHLAVIDGFRGMEGNGPVDGNQVNHEIAIASTDWVAADRIAVELMGLDFKKIGYLWFSAHEGLGQGDLTKIEVLGENVKSHTRRYRQHENINSQYNWIRR